MEPSNGVQLGGGVFARYRKSCGMCRNRYTHRVGEDYCRKAFELDGNQGRISHALMFIEYRITINQKYSVAPNMVCEDHFNPVSNRYKLD